MRAHPGVEVSFRTTASTDQTLSDLQNGGADVGFASLPVYSPALPVAELFEDELVVVVGHTHRFAGRPSVGVEDFKGERLILFERGNSIRRSTDAFFHKVGIEPRTALESNDTAFIKLMVERGLGLSLLPAWAVRDEVSLGWLAQLTPQGAPPPPHRGHRLPGEVPALAHPRLLDFMLENRARLQAMAVAEPAIPGAREPTARMLLNSAVAVRG